MITGGIFFPFDLSRVNKRVPAVYVVGLLRGNRLVQKSFLVSYFNYYYVQRLHRRMRYNDCRQSRVRRQRLYTVVIADRSDLTGRDAAAAQRWPGRPPALPRRLAWHGVCVCVSRVGRHAGKEESRGGPRSRV